MLVDDDDTCYMCICWYYVCVEKLSKLNNFFKIIVAFSTRETDLTDMIDDADAGCIRRDQNSEL